MRGELRALEDAAGFFTALAQAVVRERGSFTIALAGGRTPRPLYARLAEPPYATAIPWKQIMIFWGDERFVPHADKASNFRLAVESLLAKVPVPRDNLFPVPTEAADAGEAARRYESKLKACFPSAGRPGGFPAFDLIFLGLGRDGHIASLFPGGPECRVRKRWCVASLAPAEHPVRKRITLTLPVINNARNVILLVSGAEKAAILREVLYPQGPGIRVYPAQRVRPAGKLYWFTDIILPEA